MLPCGFRPRYRSAFIANELDGRNKRYALPAPPIPLTAWLRIRHRKRSYRRFAPLSAQSGAFAPFSGQGDWFFGCLSIGRLVPILKSIDYNAVNRRKATVVASNLDKQDDFKVDWL
jgi:hypothetical protein